MQRQMQIFDKPGEQTVSPFAKVQAISAVYFPDLKDTLRELDRTVDLYEIWIANAAVMREEDAKSNFEEGFKEAHGPYVEKFYALISELRAYAAKEFQ
jgi:hypothetical protein